jgi:tRNA A37 methylthiotransferase MiaB
MSRHLYIQTVGCQMNVLDSELVAADTELRCPRNSCSSKLRALLAAECGYRLPNGCQ